MRFTVNKSVFSKAVSAISRIVEKRNTIPILANIVLDAQGNSLSILATDLDLEMSIEIEAEVETAGAITVNGALANDIARKMSADTISFVLKDVTATISAGRSRFNLQTLPQSDFPSLSVGTFSHHFEMKSADLRRMLRRVAFAISTEETRYYLNGVYLCCATSERGDAVLRADATDGHRLARTEVSAPDGTAGMPGVIVPRKTVGELDKILELGDTVQVSVSDTKIRFEVGKAVLTSKLIDGTYPDTNRVIPPKSNTTAKASKSDLAKATDRVSTVSSARGRGVRMTFSDGTLHLFVSSPDAGEASEELQIDYVADEMQIGFNAQYINDILGNIEADQVEIFLIDAGSPARFHAVGDDSTLYILMPMRV